MTRHFRLGRTSSSRWHLGDGPTRARLIWQANRAARRLGAPVVLEDVTGVEVYRVTPGRRARRETLQAWPPAPSTPRPCFMVRAA